MEQEVLLQIIFLESMSIISKKVFVSREAPLAFHGHSSGENFSA